MKIGFIGLGIMGHPMAGHLIDAGHSLALHRVKPRHQDLLDRGGHACDSAAEAASDAEIVVLMLPDTGDVEEVLFGADGVAEAASPGCLLVDMSSISPVATRQFAERLRSRDIRYVDAPVSGGEVAAKNASLSVMVGGDEQDVAHALPILDLMAKSVVHVGAVGAGQVAKVANQMIVGMTIQAVAEALTLARRMDVDPAKVRSALMGGFASSRILEVHGQRMIEETFDPGFRIRLHRKDLGLAIDVARSLDLFLPGAALNQQLMNAAIGKGLGDKDHSALIKLIE